MRGYTINMKTIDDFNFNEKTVLLRLDLNSPIDPVTKLISNDNKFKVGLYTLKELIEKKAKVVIISHQGDIIDYTNFIPMAVHAKRLSQKLGKEIKYVDDVAGYAVRQGIKNLKPGDAVLVGNLSYLTEETLLFEEANRLTPEYMLDTYLVRSLEPVVDIYINDAFSLANRNIPSMVAFQEKLPTCAGRDLVSEVTALKRTVESSDRPNIHIFGGLKAGNVFKALKQFLSVNSVDKVLLCGISAQVMHMANGMNPGEKNIRFIKERGFDEQIPEASELLKEYAHKIVLPIDFAIEQRGERIEMPVQFMPAEGLIMDIGEETIKLFVNEILGADTIFMYGTPGVFENMVFQKGTKEILSAVSNAVGFSVICGEDTISATQKFIDISSINHVCHGGKAAIDFISGESLPLLKAMEEAYERNLYEK